MSQSINCWWIVTHHVCASSEVVVDSGHQQLGPCCAGDAERILTGADLHHVTLPARHPLGVVDSLRPHDPQVPSIWTNQRPACHAEWRQLQLGRCWKEWLDCGEEQAKLSFREAVDNSKQYKRSLHEQIAEVSNEIGMLEAVHAERHIRGVGTQLGHLWLSVAWTPAIQRTLQHYSQLPRLHIYSNIPVTKTYQISSEYQYIWQLITNEWKSY